MKLQICPFPKTCVLASLAMVLDMPFEDLMKLMPSDANPTAIIHPSFHGTPEYRGYCVEEFNFALFDLGIGLVPYKFDPMTVSGHHYFSPATVSRNIEKLMDSGIAGILVGLLADGTPHAVAWDGEKVYDPRGVIPDSEVFFTGQFRIAELWIPYQRKV